MSDKIVRRGDAAFRDLGGGVKRRVLARTPGLMTVEVRFEQGGEGAVHSHPHCQNTYVLSGRFRFWTDGEWTEVGPGDTLAFEPNAPHGTLCLEAGTLIDVFSPMREDFLAP